MSKKSKAFLYNFLSFAVLFIGFRFGLAYFTHLTGWLLPLTAAVLTTLIAPKFQFIKTQDGEKIAVSWIFLKGIRFL